MTVDIFSRGNLKPCSILICVEGRGKRSQGPAAVGFGVVPRHRSGAADLYAAGLDQRVRLLRRRPAVKGVVCLDLRITQCKLDASCSSKRLEIQS